MLTAFNKDKKNIRPESEEIGYCKFCNQEMITKNCTTKTSHFAHRVLNDCSYKKWQLTPFYRKWKDLFDNCEIEPIVKNNEGNRMIVSIQNSSKTIIQLCEKSRNTKREELEEDLQKYKLLWLVKIKLNFIREQTDEKGRKYKYLPYSRKEWFKQSNTTPVFFDLDDGTVGLLKYTEEKYSISDYNHDIKFSFPYLKIYPKEEFLEKYNV